MMLFGVVIISIQFFYRQDDKDAKTGRENSDLIYRRLSLCKLGALGVLAVKRSWLYPPKARAPGQATTHADKEHELAGFEAILFSEFL